MKISSFALALALTANVISGTVAFISGPDGNNDLMKDAVAKALLPEVKPLRDTDSRSFPPLRNQILGTEVPVSLGLSFRMISIHPTDLHHSPQSTTSSLIDRSQCMFEYLSLSRPDIHTFGNMGIGGALHAAMAPIATKVREKAASPMRLATP